MIFLMTKTYRDSENTKWFRRPKTQNQRKKLIAAEEEIREELGIHYIKGNYAHINKIPTMYDDLEVSGNKEYPCIKERMVKLFKIKYKEWSITEKKYKYKIEFDKGSNTFWIGKHKFGKYGLYSKYRNKCDYLPMSFYLKDRVYPVKINQHSWL